MLSPLENQALAHLYRYRITTPRMLAKAMALGPDQTDTLLAELQAKDMISDARQLYDDRVYHRLSNRALVECFGSQPRVATSLSRPLTGRLGLRQLREAYAVLLFCLGDSVPRIRLTPEEVKEQIPRDKKKDPLPRVDHYREGDTLGLVIVDDGRPLNRVIPKCRRIVCRHASLSGIQSRLREERFLFTFITDSHIRYDYILSADWSKAAFPLPVKVFLMPVLARIGV